MKAFINFIVFILVAVPCLADQTSDKKPAQSLDELRSRIEKVLKDTHTPGVSVAIVHRDGPEWITAIGVADVAANRTATADTLFRIGSVSKAFAGLAILKLVSEGKLSLDDPVHKLVPDVWFDNPWESTDPVRVVNLLEHTTGWDDMHLREYAKDGPNIGLKEALEYGKDSRRCRWRPGTRMAYCNTGPAVAAYIVEKITGQRFEDYVKQNLFDPIGMKTATYFQPPAADTTVLYHDDGKTPYPYWNIIYRPAGAINASANDMAAYVRFYLNRGTVNGVQVIPSTSIDRMEIPISTWAAHDGLKDGYGIYNYWNVNDGFVYHGHNGGVEGGLTEMAYLPDYDVGYSYSINSGNGAAFGKIGELIRGYVTRGLTRLPLPSPAPMPANAAAYAGWYEPDSPRVQMTYFVDRLTLRHLKVDGGKLFVSTLGSSNQFVPVEGMLFRELPKKGPANPIATLALLTPNEDGRFVQDSMQDTLKRVPTWLALLQTALIFFVVLAMFAIVLYAPFWIIGGLFRKRRRPSERGMRLWPLLAVLSLLAFTAVVVMTADDAIGLLGHVSLASVSLFLLTIAFAVFSLMGAVTVWRGSRPDVRQGVRVFSSIVVCALLIATAYLAYWGVIGLRTWA